MSSSKSSTPESISFQTDSNLGWSQDFLKNAANYLYSGLTGVGGSLSGLLGDSVSVSPEVSRLSQQLATSQLDPAFRQKRQDTINTLAANNQDTSSTMASSLANLDADYMASLTGMQAQYGLADVERALNNRVSLFGTSLNTGQAVGSNALQNQQQMNQFALQNYENQVAAAMMGEKNGINWGQLGGMAIGAGLGTMVPGVGNLVGASLGASLGGSLGGAMFGSSPALNTMNSGLGTLGGYMAGSNYMGSKIAPVTGIYASPTGSETIQNTLADNPYSLRGSPLYASRLGGY